MEKQFLYVGGYSRSGSTLLDVMLGSHPDIFSAGELTFLGDDYKNAIRSCSCGKRYPECSFWGRLYPEAMQPTAEYLTNHRKVERRKMVSDPSLKINSTALKSYISENRRILQYIRSVSGKNIILDSSKSARAAVERVAMLRYHVGEDVRMIHLTRHPHSVVDSYLRHGSNWVAEGHGPRHRFLGLRAMLGWILANRNAVRLKRKHADLPYLHIQYEDMVTDPHLVIRKISAFTGIDLQTVSDHVDRNGVFNPGHNVGGNRMRRAKEIRLKIQRKKSPPAQIPLLHKMAFRIFGGSLIRDLGY